MRTRLLIENTGWLNGNTRWLNRNGLMEKKQGNWMDMQNYLMDTQGDYMKRILMIEWKHKKIEDTSDRVQANSACR